MTEREAASGVYDDGCAFAPCRCRHRIDAGHLRRMARPPSPTEPMTVHTFRFFLASVLALAGVDVVDYHEARCEHMMADFITKHPELWNEDIGE